MATELNHEIIAFLEEWLEMAKRGDIEAIAIAAVTTGRELLAGRVENNQWATLLAAHDVSKHAMMTSAQHGGRLAR